MKFYPYKNKGWGVMENVLAMLKGAHKKFWDSLFTVA